MAMFLMATQFFAPNVEFWLESASIRYVPVPASPAL